MAAGLWPPSWIFENLNIAGNSRCGCEVSHKNLKRSDKLNKIQRKIKKSKMDAGLRPPSWIFENMNIMGNRP
jgi:hypothetical protein